MNRYLITTALVTLTATASHAGGIERTAQSVGILFEEGRRVELSFGRVNPNVSGVGAGTAPSPATPTPGGPSGDSATATTRSA